MATVSLRNGLFWFRASKLWQLFRVSAFLGLSLSLLLLMGFWLQFFLARQSLELALQNHKSTFELALRIAETNVRRSASSFLSASPENQSQVLRAMLNADPWLRSVGLLTCGPEWCDDRKVIYIDDLGPRNSPQVTAEQHLQLPRRTWKDAEDRIQDRRWSIPYFENGQWWIRYTLELRRNDEETLALHAETPLTQVRQFLPPEKNWLLLDTSGRIIGADNHLWIGRPYTDVAKQGTDALQILTRALGTEMEVANGTWLNGNAALISWIKMADTGWLLVLPEFINPTAAAVARFRYWIWSITLFCILVMVLESIMRTRARKTAVVPAPSAPAPFQAAVPASALDHALTQTLFRIASVLASPDLELRSALVETVAQLANFTHGNQRHAVRLDLGDLSCESSDYFESPHGVFFPIRLENSATSGGLWFFSQDADGVSGSGLAQYLEGVAAQITMALRRASLREEMERLNSELNQRVEARTDALRHTERMLRDVTNSVPAVVYQLVSVPGQKMQLGFVSAGVSTVFGVNREQALANLDVLWNIVYPDDLPQIMTALDDALAKRQPFHTEYRIIHGSHARICWIRSAANIFIDEDGNALLNGYWIDITDQKKLEHALEQARHDAFVASEAKSRFLANMSHEIRTPMNAIIGLTHIVMNAVEDLPVRRQLSRVEEAARNLLGLLNDILDVSKIEAGRLAIENIGFDIHDLLDRLENLMSTPAAAKSLRFRVYRAPDLPKDVLGDPLRLSQILLNLVSNAIKFTAAGSVDVEISAKNITEEAADYCFSVRDTGEGMNPGQIERLFTAFSQVDSSITRRYGGTGLGLSISKQLAQLMGGDVLVSSVPKVGSVFTLELRLQRASENWRSQTSTEQNVSLEVLSGALVLVVDDNRINQEVVDGILRMSGVVIEAVDNGQLALDALASKRYAAVLMDLQMPVMDGLTATTLLRQNPDFKRLPIIAMTANAMAGDREQCLAAGMNDHISKPIDPLRLRSVLAYWINHSRQGDSNYTLH